MNENIFHSVDPVQEIPVQAPVKIKKDRKGNTWYFPNGTKLLKEDSSSFTFYINKADKNIPAMFHIFDGWFDNNNQLWAGSYDFGLMKISDAYTTFYRFNLVDRIFEVTGDKNDNIWFMAEEQGLYHFYNHQFFHYDREQGLPSGAITTLLADSKGRLWAGTATSGIFIISGDSIARLDSENGIASDEISFVFEDTEQKIWIGSDKGLNIISQGKNFLLNKNTGLVCNITKSVVQNGKSVFWLATDKGLSRLSMSSDDSVRIRNFDKNYGLRVNSFSNACLIKNEDIILWGAGTGIISYNRYNENNCRKVPLFTLAHVSIAKDSSVISNNDNSQISVKPGGSLSVSFTAIDWGYEDMLEYEYSFAESEKNVIWSSLGTSNIFSRQNIVPGHRKLLLRAKNEAGYSKVVTIDVEFLPYWYQTGWFKLIVFFFISVLISLAFLVRGWQHRKKQEKLKIIIWEQTRAIQAEKEELKRINKIKDALLQEIHHRVKNNLQLVSSIINMQLQSAPEKKDSVNLENIQVRINAIAVIHEMLYRSDNLAHIHSKEYFNRIISSIDQLVNNSHININYTLDIENIVLKADSCIFLGILLSEAVSNSIKHAFSGISNPSITLTVRSSHNSNSLELKISDNGIGIPGDTDKKSTLGMRLIGIFAQQLNADLKINSDNSGTEVVVLIPDIITKADP